MKTYRIILFSLCLLFNFSSVRAQKNSNLTICIDSSINTDNLLIHYVDGLNVYHIDSGFVQGELKLIKPIYAPSATINISYQNSKHLAFFVDDRPPISKLTALGVNKDPNNFNVRIRRVVYQDI